MKIKIKIIYDTIDPKKRRTCFWESIEKMVDGNYEFEYISVSETIDSEEPFKILELFNKKKTDIIVLNWDSINNDMLFGSDRTFQFFNQYSPALNGWVEDGGIVIVEAQTIAWKLRQSSYDIFTKEADDCFIKIKQKSFPENRAIINTKLKNQHPLLKTISDNNEWIPELKSQKWFPENYDVHTIDHSEEKLYESWFDDYSKDWEPLLFADNEMKRPIMLCRLIKTEKKGITNVGGYILTTMFLGASGLNPLIQNLLNFPTFSRTYYKDKEDKEKNEEITRIKDKEDKKRNEEITRITKRNKWLKIAFLILIVWAFFQTILNYIIPNINIITSMLVAITSIVTGNILFHYLKNKLP